MTAVMDWLIDQVNGGKQSYIIRREGVKGKWYLKDVDIPVEDNVPLEATWTAIPQDALRFYSVDQVQDFAIAHLMPRVCTIVKMENQHV